ncbi:hypothetical protein A2159_03375 [Candidatus Woesebacteria bacterium RBG_13_34_9]|uniref:HD domain-containing protein n=1 Tax=Candidatus Woesebacteria bacterium RBG_13_34_9 TaxID=1802477 RepID=A0A1F7X1B6_9BACT|nr:MAG: hypothetical protein A2159_03375 [Candidatus Woesebacteria bacterium RBG_13_34_9]
MTGFKLNKIKIFVKKETGKIKDLQHGGEHPQRVSANAKKIVHLLGLEEKVDLNLLTATCYLHDINYAIYQPGLVNYFLEGKRTKLILPQIINNLGIKGSEKEIIENAIYNSSFSFPFRKLNKEKDLYSKILQDADTIDFFSKERIKSFEKVKKNYFFYTILGFFSNLAIAYGRNNLKKYLNFPQLAKEFYVQKS